MRCDLKSVPGWNPYPKIQGSKLISPRLGSKPRNTCCPFRRMRASPILRQLAANAARIPRPAPQSSLTQQHHGKLPLSDPVTHVPIARLRRSQQDFLPSAINAPTTLTAPFIPKTDVDLKKWFGNGKDWYYKVRRYVIFYKTGVKQFNYNRKIRKVLKADLMKSLGNINIPGSSSIAMSRSEFQMCLRTRKDWQKMPCTTRYPVSRPLLSGFRFRSRVLACNSLLSAYKSVWIGGSACGRVHSHHSLVDRHKIPSRNMHHTHPTRPPPSPTNGRTRQKVAPFDTTRLPHRGTSKTTPTANNHPRM